jgi:hypothetical protein
MKKYALRGRAPGRALVFYDAVAGPVGAGFRRAPWSAL